MRTASLLVTALGLAGTGAGAAAAWRWRGLATRTPAPPADTPADSPAEAGPGNRARESVPQAIGTALRTANALVTAGIVAGILVVGLGGRLVMRVLAVTSGDGAQGRRTDAEEIVGEISLDGTFAFVVFGGVFGGLVCAVGYLLARPWLPATAGRAGLVVGLVALGTIGVSDPLDPRNSDFAILGPLWLAVLLIAVTALLFGVTFTALAARLEAGLPRPARRWTSVVYLPAALVLVLPFGVPFALYVVGRAVSRGRLHGLVTGRAGRRTGAVVLAGGCAACTVVIALAAGKILSG